VKSDSKLSAKLDSKDFIVTAEYLPRTETSAASIEACSMAMGSMVTAVNAADNLNGVAMSSLAACIGLGKAGIEPVFQIITRDRNRIALQSDLIGAAYLGIKNVLCLSGYHQSLMGYPESANVYDIDSIQLIAAVNQMNEQGVLLNGTKLGGTFSMLIGAVANPYLKPEQLNMLRLHKKADAGAKFIQTQAVFDIEGFQRWLEIATIEGLTEKVAILAGVMPLSSAEEAGKLSDTYTDLNIPESIINRLKSAGDQAAQQNEGVALCGEIIKKIKSFKGLRGIHILSGGKESLVPEVITASGT